MSYANDLYEEIAEMCQKMETSHGTLFTAASETSGRVGTELTVFRVVGRQQNRDNYEENAEQYFCRAFSMPFLDDLLLHWKTRFLEHHQLSQNGKHHSCSLYIFECR